MAGGDLVNTCQLCDEPIDPPGVICLRCAVNSDMADESDWFDDEIGGD